ncbi:ABC transporter permease [uncultured Fibrella sp.]|uniref:ABC transporter permease n=1 Tax=uncultured Fibrella sp. TaxID=1284596 RepID=UPI0035CAB5FD
MKQLYVYLSVICLLVFLSPVCAQQSADVPPDRPVVMNGIEYGYTIRNESKKEVGSKGMFGRYEVTLYVTNRSGCSKIMMPRQTFTGLQYQDQLADFDCLNATGMRLTSKSATLKAKEFYVPYSTSTKGPDGKVVTTSVQVRVGNMLRNGESVTNDVIFIVPEGERPALRVRMQELGDF